MGMGGAFSALADDADSMIWNAAGLALTERSEISLLNTDLFGQGIQVNAFSFAKAFGMFGVGVNCFQLRDDDLDYTERSVSFGAGVRLKGTFALGANLKAYSVQSVWQATSFGADFGLLWQPTDNLRAALTVRELNMGLDTMAGGRENIPSKITVALAYTNNQLSVALDLVNPLSQNLVNLGVEYRLTSNFAFRAGLYDGNFTAGIGIAKDYLGVDYAFLNNKLGNTNRLGVRFRF